MEPLKIKQFISWLGGVVYGDNMQYALELPLPSIWMDTRKIAKGEIFLALKGEERDGHDYVEQAFKNGALYAIVAHGRLASIPQEYHGQCICVEDPLEAVQQAAKEYRKTFSIPFITVAGSNGKTSTTHAIRKLLESSRNVGGTLGNWNNHIGVPLSLLRLTGNEDVALFEVGANHEGEIAQLVEILQPTIGIITNIGFAHVGLFGDIETTARSKFELGRYLRDHGGLLYINGDDTRSVAQAAADAIAVETYGTVEGVDHQALAITCDIQGCYSCEFEGTTYHLATPGIHSLYSLFPALLIAKSLGVSQDTINETVKNLAPASLRGGVEVVQGVSYIVDCYNANPSSMNTAAKLLDDIPSSGRKIAILGDMKELGRYEKELHYEVGSLFGNLRIDAIIAVGESATIIIEGALLAGLPREICFSFSTAKEVIPFVKTFVRAHDLVLLKGSRSIALETIFFAMKEDE